ncbi:MAG: hypothetical protein K8F52_10980 [Candidatus Scalindua rubra]|nr:hypothetical protein [Candidatus Scalindua rubra]TWU28970.1 hypothetical protein S225a_26800 [Candidatus Brocadiaceae bacterium S225]
MVFNTKRVFVAIICTVFIFGFAVKVTANGKTGQDSQPLTERKIIIHIDGKTGTVTRCVPQNGKSICVPQNGNSIFEPDDLTCDDDDWFMRTYTDEEGFTCHKIPFGDETQYMKICINPKGNQAKKIILHMDAMTGEVDIQKDGRAGRLDTAEPEDNDLTCAEATWFIKRPDDKICICYPFSLLGMTIRFCFGTCP